MNYKRIKEVIGLALLGEGLIGLVYPKKYSLLWEVGPEPIREMMSHAAENPEIMRVIYAAEAGLGFWLASSQLEFSSQNGQHKRRINYRNTAAVASEDR